MALKKTSIAVEEADWELCHRAAVAWCKRNGEGETAALSRWVRKVLRQEAGRELSGAGHG